MGAHTYVEWEWAATAEAAVQALRARGTHVVALETARAILFYSHSAIVFYSDSAIVFYSHSAVV